MNSFLKRVEALKRVAQNIPSKFYWVLGNGKHIPAIGINSPLNFIVYPYVEKPAISPVSWEYSGNNEEIDPITRALFDETVTYCKAGFPALPEPEQYHDPNVIEFTEPTAADIQNAKEESDKMALIESLTTSQPNPESNNQHCI